MNNGNDPPAAIRLVEIPWPNAYAHVMRIQCDAHSIQGVLLHEY